MPFKMNHLDSSEVDTPDKLFEKTGISIFMDTECVSYDPISKIWTSLHTGCKAKVWSVMLIRHEESDTNSGYKQMVKYFLSTDMCFSNDTEFLMTFETYQEALHFLANVPSIEIQEVRKISTREIIAR